MSGAGSQTSDGTSKPGGTSPGRASVRRQMPAAAKALTVRGRTQARAVINRDPAYAATTIAVRGLAPQLGLDPDSVRLQIVDSEDDALGHSVAGASVDAIKLRPSALLSASFPVLVHELAHLAQHRNRTRPPSATAHLAPAAGPEEISGRGVGHPDVTGAEAEAAALAAALTAGRSLWVPRAVLPDGHLARLEGAVGIAPATPGNAGTNLTPATGSAPAPAEAPTTVAQKAGALKNKVSANHRAEINRIKNEVAGFWELSRDKREVVLGLLDPYPFVVARAMVQALEKDERRFLALVDDRQHHDHPISAMAGLAALDQEDIKTLDWRLTQGWGAPLHGVDVERLDQPALRGLYAVLRGQSDQALERLCGGDRRDFFRHLLDTPEPWGDEIADLDSALAVEERADAVREYSLASKKENPGVDLELIARVRALLQNRSAGRAREALSALTALAEEIEEDESFGRSGAPEPLPKPTGNAPLRSHSVWAHERIRVVVAELDKDRLVDVILDNLPEEDRYRTGPEPSQRYGVVLAKMLKNRAPGLTLGRIEDLLSYGVFDWAITDSDARFAYFLVRTLPLAEQDRWRLRDDSKWFHRLEENLPEWMITNGEYTGVGSEYLPAGPADRTQNEVFDLLAGVLTNWRDNKSKDTALRIIDQLAPIEPAPPVSSAAALAKTAQARAAPAKVPPAMAGATRNTRIAVVRRLDTLGVIDDLLNELSDEQLTSDHGRHAVDRLAALRDPVRLEEQATKLLSTGIFDWWISAREAWLAHLLLRALPPAEQKRWDREHPGKWSDMMAAVTPQLRSADVMGALTGRNGFPSLADLHERMSEPRLWDGQHNPQLRSLIIMAYAADDRHWVFDLSRRYADFLPKLGPQFVADLRLYDPAAKRTDYEDAKLELPGFGTELLNVIDKGVKLAIFVVGTGLEVVVAALDKTISLNLDLEAAQSALGGDIYGVKLSDRQRTIVGGTTREQRELREHTNLAEIRLDPGAGAFELKLPKLRLDRLNISRPGASYRTGDVELTGLKVFGTFSDRHYRKPIGFDFEMANADVRDVVLANEVFGAVALAQLLLSVLRLKSGATGAEDLHANEPREGTIGVPLFGPLLQLIDNLTMLFGGLPWPFNLSVVDLILWPLDFGLKTWFTEKLAEKAVGVPANQLVRSPQPLDYVYGLFSDGTLRPPRSITERLTDAAKMLRSLSVSFADLDISGLSLGAGLQIGAIRLHDVEGGGARSLPSHLRLLIQSLNRRIPKLTGAERDAAIAQRDAAFEQLDRLTVHALEIRDLQAKEKAGQLSKEEQAKLKDLQQAQDEVVRVRRHAREAIPDGAVGDPAELTPPTEAELRMEELERKDRWIAGSLTQAERTELADLNKLLRSDIGASLDIGGIDIGEVSGAVEAAGATVGPIHLDARVPDTLLPGISGSYLADPQLIARFKHGGRRTPTGAELGKTAQVNLTVAGIELKPDPDGGAVLRIPPGQLPSADELTKRIADLPPQVGKDIRDRLWLAGKVASRIAALQGQKDKEAQVRQLREALRRLMSVEVEHLSVGPVTGGIDPARGELTAKVAGVDARDIIGPEVMIDHATGSVEVGAALTGLPGTAGAKRSWSDFAKSAGPRVGVDLSLEGVETTFGKAKNIAIKGLAGTVETLPGGVCIRDLTATTVELGDLDIFLPTASITGANVLVTGLSADAVLVQVTGEGEAKTTEVTATNLRIKQIAGDKLAYVAATGDGTRQLTVEAVHGVLGNIEASTISYRKAGQERAEVTAQSAVGTVDVQYQVISELLSGGDRTTVTGSLTGGPGTLAGRGKTPVAGPALTVGYARGTSGSAVTLDAPGLLAADNLISAKDGSLTIRRLPVKAHVDLTMDAAGHTTGASGTVDLNDIELGPVDWRAGKRRLVSTGDSKIAAVHIEAVYSGAQPAKDGEQAKPEELKVGKCFIDGVDVADAHYTDSGGTSPIDVRLGALHAHPGAFRIDHVELHDFVLPFSDQGLDVARAGVRADITGLHLDARMVYGAIRAAGAINVRSMKVGLAQGGLKSISTTGVSAGVKVSYDDPGEPARKGRKATDPLFGTGRLTIQDATTGEITFTDSTIDVAGLHIPALDVTSLLVGWGAGGYLRATSRKPAGGVPGSAEGTVQTDPSGAVQIRDIRANAKIDRATGKIALRTMTIDHINAESITADLPGTGSFHLGPTTGTKPALSHITLGGRTDDGFVIIPNRSGPEVAGTVHVDEATIGKLGANVTGMFKGDVALKTDAIDVDLPASGKVDVRVASPHAALLGKAELDAKTTSLAAGAAIDADLLHYSSVGAELTETTMTGLEYEDSAGGIKVKVKSAKLPGKAVFARSGIIPELDITDADLTVDFTTRTGAGSGLPLMRPPVEALTEQLLDDVDGDIPLSVTLQSTPISKLGTFDIGIALDVKIVGGKLDFKDLLSQMVGAITFTPPSTVLSAGKHLIGWASDGTDVHLRLTIDVVIPVPGVGFVPVHYTHDILSWHLKKPSDVTLFNAKEQMRLYPLIDDYVPGTGSGGPTGISVTLGSATHLAVRNPKAIDIELLTGNPTGHICLAPDVAIGLGAQGTIIPVLKPGTSGAGLLTDIALKKFEVQQTNLKVTGGGTVKTGTIRIDDVKGGSLTMDGRTPQVLDLPITKASAHNIEWHFPPKPSKI